MRIVVATLAMALVATLSPVRHAEAAKSKMGCEIGTEVWNAVDGKCEPGKPKYTKRAAAPKAAKKAPAKK